MFPKGSIWRRWDLQVHTLGTAKNDQFTSSTFDDFCIVFFKKALEKKIAVVGITDYFNIDNYKKVIEFVGKIDSFDKTLENGASIFTNEEKEQIKGIYLIPNVELRMMPSTDSGRLINIHCLFNPNFINSIENDFFGSIEYSAGSGSKHKMNHQGMVNLGKSLDRNLNDTAAYKKGLNSFVVSHADLQRLYDENANFRENVIIAVSNSSNDGASALQQHYDLFENDTQSQLDAVRKSIYCISHVIFSSNSEDRKYFNGEKVDNEASVIEKCGSLKPCIHGCDAHTEEKLFNPDNNMICWIKADPTFDGLKQILWEPIERVRIQERDPSDTKSSRIIIDRLSYKNANGEEKVVQLNKDLNSIIGVRGSGKSTLLKNTAFKIDSNQFSEKDNKERLYKLDSFKVFWDDGQEDGGIDDSPKSVFYIPQNYLSSLAYEETGRAKERDEFLTKLLKKNIKFSNAIRAYEDFVSDNRIKIEGLIEGLLKTNQILLEAKEQIRKQGSRKEIEEEIANKNEEVKKYKGTGAQAITEEEVKNYTEAKQIITDSKKAILILGQDKSILNGLLESGADVYIANQEITRLSSERQLALRSELLKKSKESLSQLIKNEVNKIESEIKVLTEAITSKQQVLDKLGDKIKANKALETITRELSQLQQTLKTINELDKAITQATKNKVDAITGLVDAYNAIDAQQSTIFGTIAFDEDFSFLQIDIVTNYNKNDLKKFVEKNINTIATSPLLGNDDSDVRNLISDSPKKLTAETIKKCINKLINGEIKLKVEAAEIGQVLSQMLRDRYEVDFLNSVKTKEDSILFKNMTGGQKAIAMLELVFRFDDERYPILIDQPEDDLDVSGVATDLVNFIKTEKNKRQIIIVSHNGSLVVCADTEEVIVSSSEKQDGSYNFSYATGAIENLEIRDQIIKILEGGKEALKQRARKLNFKHEI